MGATIVKTVRFDYENENRTYSMELTDEVEISDHGMMDDGAVTVVLDRHTAIHIARTILDHFKVGLNDKTCGIPQRDQ